MKYIKNYKLYESVDNEEVISDIIYIMSDIIDSHKNIVFKSPKGDMTYNDYLSKSDKYKKFQPIYKAGNKLKSKFSIIFNKISDYDKLASLINEMAVVIDRLKQDGWFFTKMNMGNYVTIEDKLYFTNLDYEFSKSSEVVDTKLPKEEEVADVFNSTVPGLRTQPKNIDVYDNFVEVEFDSIEYDGEIPNGIENYFDKVVDLLGFAEYEYDRRQPWGIKFWYN